MLEAYPDVLTVRDVKEILYFGKNKVYELLTAGDIKGIKVGRDWRVTKDEVKRYVKGQ